MKYDDGIYHGICQHLTLSLKMEWKISLKTLINNFINLN